MPDLKSLAKDTVQLGGAATGSPIVAITINTLVDLIWPSPTDPDMYWNQIKDQVKEYIEEQSITDQKNNLNEILYGGGTVTGGIKAWLDNAKVQTDKQNVVADLVQVVDQLITDGGLFGTLDKKRASAVLPYFIEMASMHLFAIAYLIKLRQQDSSLTASFTLQWYQDMFQQKLREYWLFSYEAVQASISERLEKIKDIDAGRTSFVYGEGNSSTLYTFGFRDEFPGVTNPVYEHDYSDAKPGSPDDARNDVTNHRNAYIATIREQCQSFWKKTVLDVSSEWGKTFIEPATGAPSACIYQGVPHIVFRGQRGGIFHLDNASKAFIRLNGTGLTDAPLASGDPSITAYDGDLHVTYAAGGAVWDVFYDSDHHDSDGTPSPRWLKQHLNNSALTTAPDTSGIEGVSTPGLVFGSDFHVTFQNADIWDIYNDGTWHSQMLNHGGLTDAPQASAFYNLSTAMYRGTMQVIYLEIDHGEIWHIWYDGTWHSEKLNNGGITDGDVGQLGPVGFTFKDQFHVVYQGQSNICDLWYDGAWHSEKLNNGGLTTAPEMYLSNLAAYATDSQIHVVCQGIDGNIWDLWYQTVWNAEQMNNGGLTAAPQSGTYAPLLGAYVYNNEQHVLYRHNVGALYDMYYVDGKWDWTTLFDPYEG